MAIDNNRTSNINLTISQIGSMMFRSSVDLALREEMRVVVVRLAEIRDMPDKESQDEALRGLTEQFGGGIL